MTIPAPATALKPCPFCGSEAVVKRNRTVMVNCTHCTAATFQRLRDEASAIANWNTRSALSLALGEQ